MKKLPLHAGAGMTSQRTRERLIERLRTQGIRNEQVLEVMLQVPRHIFVDEALASRAYEETALPIGYGQTISQPYIVARMTEALLAGGPVRKVLEVGTGSGYQAAILSYLVEQVYGVERLEALLKYARARFMALGIRNIRLQHSDGRWGWPEYGPYDGIIVTAASPEIPKELLQQLPVGGRMLIPVGVAQEQTLKRIVRTPAAYEVQDLEKVVFVPMRAGNQ